MMLSINAGDGKEIFTYDTDKRALCRCPARVEIPSVRAVLAEADAFLRGLDGTPQGEPLKSA